MKKNRFFLMIALAAAVAGSGSAVMVAASEIPPEEEGGSANGNLYHREGGKPEWLCWCGGEECAPCAGGGASNE